MEGRLKKTKIKSRLAYHPSVDVIMIVSRPQLSGFYLQAYNSVNTSVYEDLSLIEVDNLDKSMSIGKAWNMAVEQSEAEYVYFMGDDDIIMNDLIYSSIIFADQYKLSNNCYPDFVGSGFISISAQGAFLETRNEQPTGLWRTSFVKDLKFNEDLDKLVDSDFFERASAKGAKIAVMPHHFGYLYRQHEGMVSGRKTIVT